MFAAVGRRMTCKSTLAGIPGRPPLRCDLWENHDGQHSGKVLVYDNRQITYLWGDPVPAIVEVWELPS